MYKLQIFFLGSLPNSEDVLEVCVSFLYSLNQPSNNVPILLDGVGCRSGSPPPRLIDCSHNGVGVHDCSHNEDIGLVCLGGNLFSRSMDKNYFSVVP